MKMFTRSRWIVLLVFSLTLILSATEADAQFITTWRATGGTIRIPNGTVGAFNYNVAWRNLTNTGVGDGTVAGQTGNYTITSLADGDIYEVTITGNFPHVSMASATLAERDKLLTLEHWGSQAWQSMAYGFQFCRYLTNNATDVPNVSNVSDFSFMFNAAYLFTADLNAWDVSNATNMRFMFSEAFSFNGNISAWDVSNVTDMSVMFQSTPMNQDLSGWDVGNVTTMTFMFNQSGFNGDVTTWNVGNVTDMSFMFTGNAFNQDISGWDVSNVTNMNGMFENASSFDQDLGGWNVRNVTNMTDMFRSSGLSNENYDKLLIGWAALPSLQGNVTLGASGKQYCAGEAARNVLTSLYSWTIDDAGKACYAPANAFVTLWKTDNLGGSSSAANEILIPVNALYTYNYNVYWEDTIDPTVNGTLSNAPGGLHIIFPTAGTYRVYITGTFPAIQFNGWDLNKLLSVEQWGNNHWLSMNNAFARCANLVINASDAPDLSGVTDMSEMFRQASSVNQDINHWDVSTVTNMSGMFRRAISYNQPLNNWDVSAVTNMQYMFSFATAFNQNIDSWDVSNVTDMSNMFSFTNAFNQPLNSWDVSSVTTMASMFYLGDVFNQPVGSWDVSSVTNMSELFMASDFNQDISGWNVSAVTNMRSMFTNLTTFNQDLSSWDVSSVTDMSDMFLYAVDFNSTIGNWNVSSVTNMSRMLQRCYSFNQDIGSWDVGAVTNMLGMFVYAYSFNQDISGWDVSNVINMSYLFEDAAAFNQNLGSWNVRNVTDMTHIFSTPNIGPGLSTENYDNTLIGWAALPTLQSNVMIGAVNKTFCAAESARNTLISTYNWTFTGDFRSCPAPMITSFTPTSGLAGTEVTINGTDFTGANAVFFGTTPAASYTVVNATTITAILGNGSSGALYVATPEGGDFSTDSFTFYGVPTIDSFTPTSASSGATVTISGSNFTDASSVTFGGIVASSFTVVDANTITAVVGVGTSGNVEVTVPGGTATLGGFTLTQPAQPPVITAAQLTTRIEGIVTLDLVPLITTSSALDLSSLKILDPPASGAQASIDANGILTLDYTGIQFSGLEQLRIEACDINSNCASQLFSIEVADDLIVYNGISPGGMNPELIIEHINILEDARKNTVTIFDRWQNEVWSGNNYDNTAVVFKGVSDSGKELPSGVYFYRIDFGSKRKRQAGFISIKR